MSTGRFSPERRGAEVLVHRVEPGEQLAGTAPGPIAIIVESPIAESIE